MSTPVLENFSQSSKAYKFGYILIGYSLTFLGIPLTKGGDPTTYLITVAIVGGFIGTSFVFIKPLKILLYVFYKRQYKSKHSKVLPPNIYFSPYLNEAKGEVYGGILFSGTCIIAFFNSNFDLVSFENVLIIRAGLIALSVVVGVLTYRRYDRIKYRFGILELYYEQVESRVYSKSGQIIDDLRLALNRQDWDEAFTILGNYTKFKEEYKGTLE